MNDLDTIFTNLWQQYSSNNTQAQEIHSLLVQKGQTIVNDHVAFRTFNHPKVNMLAISQIFCQLGYEQKGEYDFAQKKLNAVHLEHPSGKWPLVFISELRLEDFSSKLRETVNNLINELPDQSTSNEGFLWSGVRWSMISHQTYLELLSESEYAAWTASFGYCANHFTIYVNALSNYNLKELNSLLKTEGFNLNTAGGEIKGSMESGLEQSSTLASKMTVDFSDKSIEIPCCYYEFAQRHTLPNGELFKGFIAKSADKIFESTDTTASD